jgi:hypothetical protein
MIPMREAGFADRLRLVGLALTGCPGPEANDKLQT